MKTSAIWRAFLFAKVRLPKQRLSKEQKLFGFKNPFLVHGKTYKHVDDICDNVCQETGLHESGNDLGKRGCERLGEKVDATFQDREIYPVGADEYHQESYNLRLLVVAALEVPDAVAKVAVAASGNKTQEIG